MAGKAVHTIRGHWERSASFGVPKADPNAWVAERLVNLYRRRAGGGDALTTGYLLGSLRNAMCVNARCGNLKS